MRLTILLAVARISLVGAAVAPTTASATLTQGASCARRAGETGRQAWRLLARALRSACRRGAAEDCNQLGVLTLQGRGMVRSAPRAVALFASACELGSARGCNNLGIARATGEGGLLDLGAALELFEIACAGGLREACDNARRARDALGLTFQEPVSGRRAWGGRDDAPDHLVVADVVRPAEGHAGSDPGAREPHGERARVVTAAEVGAGRARGARLAHRRASELAAPHDQRVVEQAASL